MPATVTYATGRYTKTEILRRLTALGMRTLSGKSFTAQSLGSLLKNRMYAGWLEVRSWELTARGDFEPLVSEMTFRTVQQVRHQRWPFGTQFFSFLS